jgi:SAM-dependent methyltransferase
MAESPNQHASNASFEFDALREARNYRHALLREFGPELRGRVLEVGSGIGQITELLRTQPGVNQVLALEPDGRFCRQLQQRLPGQPVVQGTSAALRADVGWNAIVSINVLEHIEQDAAELAAYAALLRAEHGTLCLFVPARPEIYAPLDRDFGHYRRYTRPELSRKLTDAGFQLARLSYFNFVGYFAWWLSFRVLGQRQFKVGSVRLFDRCIFPVVHAWESHVCRPPLGQSLLAVARAS